MFHDDYTVHRPADFDYDAALSELQEKIRRKKKAKNLLAHFTEEATRLTSIVEDRKKEYEQEQEEADSLQSATLTLLFYSLIGLKEAKLSKEAGLLSQCHRFCDLPLYLVLARLGR